MKSVQEQCFYLGLIPQQFLNMTLSEIKIFIIQRTKKIIDENITNDRRTARICCILANINRDKKRNPKPFQEKDFMPEYDFDKNKKPKKRKMSIDQMSKVLTAITIANGGVINNGRNSVN